MLENHDKKDLFLGEEGRNRLSLVHAEIENFLFIMFKVMLFNSNYFFIFFVNKVANRSLDLRTILHKAEFAKLFF